MYGTRSGAGAELSLSVHSMSCADLQSHILYNYMHTRTPRYTTSSVPHVYSMLCLWLCHTAASFATLRPRWEGWTVKIEDSGPIGELSPQTMIGDDPKPLEANGGARGITYFRI